MSQKEKPPLDFPDEFKLEMSVSPQSLARSRDKRPHRIPARFDDFSSEIPTDLALRKAVENSKRQKGAAARQSSSPEQIESPVYMSIRTVPQYANRRLNSETKRALRERSKQGTSTPQPGAEPVTTSKGTSPKSNASTSSTPLTPEPPVTRTSRVAARNEEVATVSAAANARKVPAILRTPADKASVESQQQSSSQSITEAEPVTRAASELEARLREIVTREINKETAASEVTSQTSSQETIDTEKSSEEPMTIELPEPEDTLKSDSLPIESLKPIENNNPKTPVTDDVPLVTPPKSLASRENIIIQNEAPTSKTNMPNLEQALRRPDGNIVRKSPFHPSITISGNASQKSGLFQPKGEKRASPVADATPPALLKKRLHKNPRGHSLIKHINGTGVLNGSPNLNATNGNLSNRQPNGGQQAKYITNTQNVQSKPYRLMLNEGIYLPTSVAPIQPITATYPAIANLARQFPFVSRKTEDCMKFQDALKMGTLFSGYPIMVKIAKHLNLQDRISMRLVSKGWRSVIDTPDVWRSVTLRPNDSHINVHDLKRDILDRYRTQELIVKDFSIDPRGLEDLPHLRQLTFISTCAEFNRNILEYLYLTTTEHRDLDITWKVRAFVDDDGVATAEVYRRKEYSKDVHFHTKNMGYTCYDHFPELGIADTSLDPEPLMIEIDEIEKWFEKMCEKDLEINIDQLSLVQHPRLTLEMM